jgi:hypothetical protein
VREGSLGETLNPGLRRMQGFRRANNIGYWQACRICEIDFAGQCRKDFVKEMLVA